MRQSKYIHSCGVRHDDVKPENIMLRGHRSFLIDFNTSAKLAETTSAGTRKFLARRFFNQDRLRYPVDDWESFLYSMCELNNVPLKWFDERPFKGLDSKAANKMLMMMKNDTEDTLVRIKKN